MGILSSAQDTYLMKKYLRNKPLSYFLLLAFLTLQWSANHIHLAGEHAHDGDQHQHAVTAHQHPDTTHHADAIDVTGDTLPHVGDNTVVELDHTCTHPQHQNLPQLAILPPVSGYALAPPPGTERIAVPRKLDHFQSYHQYSTQRLRAPPVFS